MPWFRLPGSSSRSCGSKGVCCSESRLSNVGRRSPDVRGRSSPRRPPARNGLPRFRLPDLGEGRRARGLRHARPACPLESRVGFCREIAADLARLQEDLQRRKTELVLVSYGSPESNRALLEAHGLLALCSFSRTVRPSRDSHEWEHPRPTSLTTGTGSRSPSPSARVRFRLAEEAAGRRRLASERPLAESLIERRIEGRRFGAGFRAAGSCRSARFARRQARAACTARLQRSRVRAVRRASPRPRSIRARASGERPRSRHGRPRGAGGEPTQGRRSASSSRSCSNKDGGSRQYGIFATPVAFLIDEEIERDVARGTRSSSSPARR